MLDYMKIKNICGNQWFVSICCSLIAALLLYLVGKEDRIELQYWQGCLILFFCFLFPLCIQELNKKYRIRKTIKEFTYGRFGDSLEYKWEYVKSEGGIYGYEPVNIQLAGSKTIPENSHVKVFTFGRALDESKLKLLIKSTVYYCVERDEEILPFLEYLYRTEKA